MAKKKKDPSEDIGTLLGKIGLSAETLQAVKFGRGVVGKGTVGLVSMMAVFAVIAIRIAAGDLLALGLIVAVVFALFHGANYRLGTTNPAAALLDGAELIKYTQIQAAAAKGLPAPPESEPATLDPSQVPPERDLQVIAEDDDIEGDDVEAPTKKPVAPTDPSKGQAS